MPLYASEVPDENELTYFLKEVIKPEWNLEQDRGRSFEEGVKLLSTQYPDYAALIAMFDKRWIETLGGTIKRLR